MRIIHPNHPLAGQTAVLKRSLQAAGRQPARYIISHPQTGTISIPQTWAIPEQEAIESPPPTVTAVPPVTLHTLLALAKLVQTMQTHAPEETHDPAPIIPQASRLGKPATSPPAGIDSPAGRPAYPIPNSPDKAQEQPTNPGGGR